MKYTPEQIEEAKNEARRLVDLAMQSMTDSLFCVYSSLLDTLLSALEAAEKERDGYKAAWQNITELREATLQRAIASEAYAAKLEKAGDAMARHIAERTGTGTVGLDRVWDAARKEKP